MLAGRRLKRRLSKKEKDKRFEPAEALKLDGYESSILPADIR